MAEHEIAQSKSCTKCGTAYPATLEFFFRSKFGRFGLKAICKTCAVMYNRGWQRQEYEKNREKVLGYGKKFRERHAEKYRAKERDRQKRRGSRAAAHREWSEKNRQRLRPIKRAAEIRRRAAKRGAEGSHTPDDVQAILSLQKQACYYCAALLGEYHVDHFVPLSRGGANSFANIVVACQRCNLAKHQKLPWEWMPARFPPECQPR